MLISHALTLTDWTKLLGWKNYKDGAWESEVAAWILIGFTSREPTRERARADDVCRRSRGSLKC